MPKSLGCSCLRRPLQKHTKDTNHKIHKTTYKKGVLPLGGKQSQNSWRGHDLRTDEYNNPGFSERHSGSKCGLDAQQWKQVKQDVSVYPATINTHCIIIDPAEGRVGANTMMLDRKQKSCFWSETLALLFGLHSTQLNKLQSIPDSAACLLNPTCSSQNITPTLFPSCSSPSSLSRTSPPMTSDLLQHHWPTCHLHSADSESPSTPSSGLWWSEPSPPQHCWPSSKLTWHLLNPCSSSSHGKWTVLV